MSDAPENIWALDRQHIGAITHGEWADCIRHGSGDEYVRADLHAAAIARAERAEAALAVAEEALRKIDVGEGWAAQIARDALAKIAALKGGDA